MHEEIVEKSLRIDTLSVMPLTDMVCYFIVV